MTIDEQVDAYLKEQGITFDAQFRPKPQPEARQVHEFQVHWHVYVNGEAFEYQTGIGYLPPSLSKPKNPKLASHWRAVKNACETGRGWTPKHYKPKAASVLSCLILDGQALDYADFVDWADDTGYDSDSRSAEEIYEACRTNARKLRKALTRGQIDTLTDLLQDY